MSTKTLFGPVYQGFGSTRPIMAPHKSTQLTGSEIAKRREARGWSQQTLAGKIGVRQNTIAQIELGKTKKSKHLPDIAAVLDDPDEKPNQTSRRPVTILGEELVGTRDLPLFAAVEAGDGMLVMGSDPIGEVRRPAPLEGVRGGFGLMVVGESMTPVLRPGDIVLIHPHLPPRPEDVVVFVSDRHGEMTATIKEYVGQTKDLWKVRRYKPKEQDFTLKKAEWRVHGVMVGKYNRR